MHRQARSLKRAMASDIWWHGSRPPWKDTALASAMPPLPRHLRTITALSQHMKLSPFYVSSGCNVAWSSLSFVSMNWNRVSSTLVVLCGSISLWGWCFYCVQMITVRLLVIESCRSNEAFPYAVTYCNIICNYMFFIFSSLIFVCMICFRCFLPSIISLLIY